ncbi:MAG: tryptophan-rich sensory protein [Blastocatellia bacterium]|nr:tryptophan-rich sensory protein [Blastocatellia bacterium]
MTEKATGTDTFRAILVLTATIGTIIFNYLAAMGHIGGVTPAEISDKYPTLLTPAGYAFSIWSLIYLGLVAFSIYQLLPANIARFRNLRSLYIISAALNCAWIYFWHRDDIAICLALITALLISLFLINLKLMQFDGIGDFWAAKAPFGIYFGWVTAATLVNFMITLAYWGVELSDTTRQVLAISLILLAAALGVIVRFRMANYLYPLAIAWALTAIAVRQSGQTLLVAAAALGVVMCLIATLSLVVNLPGSDRRAVND